MKRLAVCLHVLRSQAQRRELPYSPDMQATRTVLDQAQVLSQEWAVA